MLNIALRILRDANEAEDMVQSVFLEIFRTAAQFDVARSSAKVWILQYAYHRSFNRRRYLSLRGFYERLEEPVSTERRQIAPHGTALSALDSARVIEQALQHLNKVQREILELFFYEGLTMHEIAAKKWRVIQ